MTSSIRGSEVEATSGRLGSSKTTVLVLVCSCLLVAALSAFILLDKVADGTNLFFTAPTQIILGSTIVLLIFLIFVVGFRRMGLTDPQQALGLPEGSIRAIIAVLLLVIFFILVNVIFGSFSSQEDLRFGPLSQAQVTQLLEEYPDAVVTGIDSAGEDTQFRGVIPGHVDDSTEKLGLQMFTALMTLVSAVTAFYFGTNSVKAATDSAMRVSATGGDAAVVALSILRPSGSPILLEMTGTTWTPIAIELSAPADIASVEGDPAGSVLFVPSEGLFRYAPGEPEDVVKLTFARRDRIGEIVTLLFSKPADTSTETPGPPSVAHD